jgi:hypothetical protein
MPDPLGERERHRLLRLAKAHRGSLLSSEKSGYGEISLDR